MEYLGDIWMILLQYFENFKVKFGEYYNDIWVISGLCLGDIMVIFG